MHPSQRMRLPEKSRYDKTGFRKVPTIYHVTEFGMQIGDSPPRREDRFHQNYSLSNSKVMLH